MKNHLVYFTYGEEKSSVYNTQVIELLNHWSNRSKWRITLIQISNYPNTLGLSDKINFLHVKRRNKWLFNRDIRHYSQYIYKKVKLNSNEMIFFSSRGDLAYNICSHYIKEYNVIYAINNLDIRGIPEEILYNTKRFLFYPIIKKRFVNTLKTSSSITTVSSNLKKYILNCNKNLSDTNVYVVPTLSILDYDYSKNYNPKKDLIFVGNILWIKKNIFINNIIKLYKKFYNYNWKIKIIGNKKVIKKLKKNGIDFYDRVSPKELNKIMIENHTGLILRDNSIVNKVSAPCKIADYLCSGMPIIYSGQIGSINDFLKLFPEHKNYIVNLEDILVNDDRINHLININYGDRQRLSEDAKKYFNINSVIDKYIYYFYTKIQHE